MPQAPLPLPIKTDMQWAIHHWIIDHFKAEAINNFPRVLYTIKETLRKNFHVTYNETGICVDRRVFEYADPKLFDSVEKFITVRLHAGQINYDLNIVSNLLHQYKGSEGLSNWQKVNFDEDKIQEIYNKIAELREAIQDVFPPEKISISACSE